MRYPNMNETLKRLFALLPAMMLLSPAIAQDDPAAADSEVEEIRRYTVEVIIFSYAEDFGRGTEQFYPDPPAADELDEPGTEDAGLIDEIEVAPARPGIALAIYAANMDTLRYVPLAEDEYTLTDIIDRFELLDAYDTVMHFGWTQPTLPPEYTKPVSLHAYGAPPAGLDGRFELYLSRYLHLVVDLALAASGDVSPAEHSRATPRFGDARLSYEEVAAEYGAAAPVFYRIQEDRIFKNGDIRYFDHPKFGVVAKVTRVEEEAEEPPEPEPLLSRTGQ